MKLSLPAILIAVGLPLSCWLVSQVAPTTGFAQPTAQADTGQTWETKQKFKVPEAYQAAAADEKFFYAIASEKIARYDRASGEKLATSIGEAKHLNSGFLWKGKLFCAHSNYPRTPEQSEIRVLDPDSMKLDTFKDFGNFGGSLTWAVRKGKEPGWWCNFAHYGAANDQTFLIRFDDEWKEQGRWTYPREVLRQIGTASISGGLWRDDTLFVTDHDHRRLYKLKVPSKGKVLEYVGQDAAPFTGQGIAADPVTGGLIGIDRANTEVHFAMPRN
jgi:hypothetical protein